jgi:hypothetical protein
MNTNKSWIPLAIVLFFLFCAAVLAQETNRNFTILPPVIDSSQQVQMANRWNLTYVYSSWTDPKTRFFTGPEGQGFESRGTPIFICGGWFLQTSWMGTFSPCLLTPDAVSIECKGVFTTGILRIFIAIQDMEMPWHFYMLIIERKISSPEWGTFVWDTRGAKEYVKSIYRFYVILQYEGTDSSGLGGIVMARNLMGINSDGTLITIDKFGFTTGISQDQVPRGFDLEQNYPNPFNPTTIIKFSVPERGQINLTVFNSLGQEMKTLVSREMGAGSYEMKFNASSLPSGVYYCRLATGGKIETKKMILMK